jgi:hypothetical protein
MYRQESRIIVSLTTSILIFAFYSLYVYYRFIEDNPGIVNDFKFWGKAFIYFIPIAIVIQIIIHIIFAIVNKIVTNEDIPMVSDEMDRIIELKALRISHWTCALGFMLGMGSQAIGMAPWILILCMLIACFLSTVGSELAKIYMYRKGV